MTATTKQLEWERVSNLFYRIKGTTRFDVTYVHDRREWVAIDGDTGKKHYGDLTAVKEWSETQLLATDEKGW